MLVTLIDYVNLVEPKMVWVLHLHSVMGGKTL